METSGACCFDAYADDGFAIVGVIFYRNFDNKSQNIVKGIFLMEKFNIFM